MSFWDNLLTETITYKEPISLDSNGDIIYSALKTTKAKYRHHPKVITTKDGTEIYVNTLIVSKHYIPIGSIVYFDDNYVNKNNASVVKYNFVAKDLTNTLYECWV